MLSCVYFRWRTDEPFELSGPSYAPVMALCVCIYREIANPGTHELIRVNFRDTRMYGILPIAVLLSRRAQCQQEPTKRRSGGDIASTLPVRVRLVRCLSEKDSRLFSRHLWSWKYQTDVGYFQVPRCDSCHVSVLIVSGSPMVHAFRIPGTHRYIKLPCLSRTLSGSYDVKYLELGYENTVRLTHQSAYEALLTFPRISYW